MEIGYNFAICVHIKIQTIITQNSLLSSAKKDLKVYSNYNY